MERQPGNLMLFYEMAALLRLAIDTAALTGTMADRAEALLRRFEEVHECTRRII